LFIFNTDIRYNKFNKDRTGLLAIAYKLQNGNYYHFILTHYQYTYAALLLRR